MNLFDQINNDIKSAMKAKDKEKLEPLRAVKAAFLMAKTEKGGDGELGSDTELKIIQKLVKQRKDAAVMYKENDRMDLCDKELMEAKVIEHYLPAQLSQEELDNAIKAIVEKVGATGPQDMGKVMGAASKTLSGKAEGRAIADGVKKALTSL